MEYFKNEVPVTKDDKAELIKLMCAVNNILKKYDNGMTPTVHTVTTISKAKNSAKECLCQCNMLAELN